jgi:hypothetical protein
LLDDAGCTATLQEILDQIDCISTRHLRDNFDTFRDDLLVQLVDDGVRSRSAKALVHQIKGMLMAATFGSETTDSTESPGQADAVGMCSVESQATFDWH